MPVFKCWYEQLRVLPLAALQFTGAKSYQDYQKESSYNGMYCTYIHMSEANETMFPPEDSV